MKLSVVARAVCRRNWLHMRAYLFNTLSGLITVYIVFCFLFFGAQMLGGPTLQEGDTLEAIIVGYWIWSMAIFAFSDLSWALINEAQFGTLEQLYLSPAGFRWVSIFDQTTNLVLNGLLSVVMLLAAMATTGRWLRLDVLTIIPLALLTVAGAYGIGFAMGGLALVFKRIQAFFQVVQFIFIGFLVVPIASLPWAKLLPLAQGNHLLRLAMVEGVRLWKLPGLELAILAFVGAAYLGLGMAAYARCESIAKNRGLLGHY